MTAPQPVAQRSVVVSEAEPNVFIRTLNWFGTFKNLLAVFGSTGVGGLVGWFLPFDWNTATPWLLTACSFTGTWLGMKSIHAGFGQWRRYRNPSLLWLSADSGDAGCVGIRHRGEPTTISATGRIVKLLDGSPNPSPHRFECRLSRGGKGELARLFHDGDWAQIVLALGGEKEFSSHPEDVEHDGLLIRRGSTVVSVPDSGALLEIEFKASPPLKRNVGVMIHRFTVRWNTTDRMVRVEEELSL